jgi:DNA-binding HxlR family transcriptional regulator
MAAFSAHVREAHLPMPWRPPQWVQNRWALLALRELGFGVARFNDIQVNTGAPRASPSAGLRSLEDFGLVERRRYSEHPPRDEYLLTDAGRELVPVLGELRAWGEKHASPRVRPASS